MRKVNPIIKYKRKYKHEYKHKTLNLEDDEIFERILNSDFDAIANVIIEAKKIKIKEKVIEKAEKRKNKEKSKK